MKIPIQVQGSVLLVAAIGAGSLTFASNAAPEELVFKEVSRPTITRAIDIVIDTEPKEIQAGDDLGFTQRVTPNADRVRVEGFQVRIFSLGFESAAPVPATATIDNCLVFVSAVYAVGGSNNPKIPVAARVNEGWLDLTSDQRAIRDGYYLLVFEKSGSSERIFRIHKDDASKYFATGIRLIVHDDHKTSLEAVIASRRTRDAARDSLQGELMQNGVGIPCYRYQIYAARGEPEQVALAPSPCVNDVKG